MLLGLRQDLWTVRVIGINSVTINTVRTVQASTVVQHWYRTPKPPKIQRFLHGYSNIANAGTNRVVFHSTRQ